jgi:hypothetical protein
MIQDGPWENIYIYIFTYLFIYLFICSSGQDIPFVLPFNPNVHNQAHKIPSSNFILAS